MRAVTNPPFYPHADPTLMICGECGLAMGRTWLLQIAHISWHEQVAA